MRNSEWELECGVRSAEWSGMRSAECEVDRTDFYETRRSVQTGSLGPAASSSMSASSASNAVAA